MHLNPLELIEELLHRRYFGKYRGKVVDNNDLMRLGRVKVTVDGIIDSGGLWAWGELLSEVFILFKDMVRTEKAQITINDLVGEVAIKNEMEASVTLALDVKTEAAGVSTHTVGALGVVSESVPGKLEVGAAGVNINNGA